MPPLRPPLRTNRPSRTSPDRPTPSTGQIRLTRRGRTVPPAVPVVPPALAKIGEEVPAVPSPRAAQAYIDRYAMFETETAPPPASAPAAAPAAAAPGAPKVGTPRRTRLVVVGLLLAVAGVAIFLWSRRDDSDQQASGELPADIVSDGGNPARSSTSVPIPPVAGDQWIPFTDPEGRFSIELPEQPIREADHLQSANGPVEADLFTSEAGGETAVVAVLQLDAPAPTDLNAVATAIAMASGHELDAVVPSVDGGGRNQLDARLVNVTGANFLLRLLDWGNGRVYAVMAGSPSGFPDATYNRLLGSFKPN